jgi:hypothetical protein
MLANTHESAIKFELARRRALDTVTAGR